MIPKAMDGLLFGVAAVRLKYVSAERLAGAAEAWQTSGAESLAVRATRSC